MNFEYPKPHHLTQLKHLWRTAFEDEPPFIEHFFSTGYHPRRCRIATKGNALTAMLFWFPCQYDGGSVAYLYGVATDPAFRNRGLCRALMEDTHKLLKKEGYAGTVLVPGSAELFTMYQGFGYAPFGGMDTIKAAPEKSNLSLRELSPEEYLRLRRTYLPPHSVLQEDILPFFPGTARLYAGQDFLLAAEKDGAFLRGIELLGNAHRAGEILYALGVSEGAFRVPGSTRFAMFFPLRETAAPAYFGLAFD